MKKLFSFLAGGLCGALVGGVTALLLTPASGEELQAQAKARWEESLAAAQRAREERQRELEAQFNIAARS